MVRAHPLFPPMSIRRWSCIFGVLWLSLLVSGRAAGWFPRGEGDVVVVTDMTAAGRLRPPPTVEAPVYFKGLTLGCRLGSIRGDKEPNPEVLSRFVTKLLRRQGYRGSPGPHRPPELLLVLQWGYLGAQGTDKLWFLGYNADDDIGYSPHPNLLGPEVFLRGLRTREVETVLDLANEPLYGVIVTAFEHESAKGPEPVLLWQTRISFAARGKSMEEALPTMLATAASQIGRETTKPVLRDPDDGRRAEVTWGEMQTSEVREERER